MSELYELPDGWEWKPLGEISGFQGGSQPPKKEFIYEERENYVRFLQIRDFSSDKNITYIPIAKKNRLCNKEDILIGRYGASVGKILSGKSGAYNVAIMKTSPNYELITKRFFYMYLISPHFQTPLLNEVSQRAAQNGFSKNDISTFEVPLPPLQEQKRIVSKLDTLFEKIDKAIALHQTNMSEADVFMGSVLNDVFGELEERYPVKTVDEISLNVRYGYTDSAKDKGNAVFIRITDIKDNGKFKDNFVYVDIEDKELNKFKLHKGDILVARSGATAGKVALFDLNLVSVFASYLIRIQPNSEISSTFLFYFCHSPIYWNQLVKIKVGGAQPNVNATNLKELKLAVPPISTQEKIVKYLDQISQKTEKVKQVQKEKMESLKALISSLLDQAFRGEL